MTKEVKKEGWKLMGFPQEHISPKISPIWNSRLELKQIKVVRETMVTRTTYHGNANVYDLIF